jgi:hypothetical protein
MTDTANLKFMPKFVRVTVTDNTGRRSDLENDGPD